MPNVDETNLLIEAKNIIQRFLILDPEICKIPPLLRRDAELLLQDKISGNESPAR